MSLLLIALTLAAQDLDLPKGDPIAPNLPPVTSWHFTEIGGNPTPLTGDLLRDDRYAIDIFPGGFVGYSGCNRFSGSFTRSGNLVTIRPGKSTQGTCREPMRSLERRLFEIFFSKPVRVSTPDGETLLLIGERGSVRLARTKD